MISLAAKCISGRDIISGNCCALETLEAICIQAQSKTQIIPAIFYPPVLLHSPRSKSDAVHSRQVKHHIDSIEAKILSFGAQDP